MMQNAGLRRQSNKRFAVTALIAVISLLLSGFSVLAGEPARADEAEPQMWQTFDVEWTEVDSVEVGLSKINVEYVGYDEDSGKHIYRLKTAVTFKDLTAANSNVGRLSLVLDDDKLPGLVGAKNLVVGAVQAGDDEENVALFPLKAVDASGREIPEELTGDLLTFDIGAVKTPKSELSVDLYFDSQLDDEELKRAHQWSVYSGRSNAFELTAIDQKDPTEKTESADKETEGALSDQASKAPTDMDSGTTSLEGSVKALEKGTPLDDAQARGEIDGGTTSSEDLSFSKESAGEDTRYAPRSADAPPRLVKHSFTYTGKDPDGMHVYSLTATVRFDDYRKMATPHYFSLTHNKGGMNGLHSIAARNVALWSYNKDTAEPHGLKGDVITWKLSSVQPLMVMSTQLKLDHKLSNPNAYRDWHIFSGNTNAFELIEADRPLPPPDTYNPPTGTVPKGKARVVVQVGEDLWMDGVSPVGGQRKSNPSRHPDHDRAASVRDVSPAQGARLRLYPRAHAKDFGTKEANFENPPDRPLNDSWATCTVDSNGECVFLIPVTGDKKANYYWIAMDKPSAGYEDLHTLRIGGSGATTENESAFGRSLRYAFATPNLKSGKAYYSGAKYRESWKAIWNREHGSDQGAESNSFMAAHPVYNRWKSNLESEGARPRSSNGVFQQRRVNPGFHHSCVPMKAAIVLDTSGSIGKLGRDRTADAVNKVIDRLQGTHVQLSLFTFGNHSPRIVEHLKDGEKGVPDNITSPLVLSEPSNVEELRDWVSAYQKSPWPADVRRKNDNGTNWEAGFKAVAKANNEMSEPYDTVIFITDGNPTLSNRLDGAGWDGRDWPYDEEQAVGRDTKAEGIRTDFRHVEAAVAASNLVKSQGTRVVAVAIPSRAQSKPLITASEHNLAAISGTTKYSPRLGNYNEADYFSIEDDSQLGNLLNRALNRCGITVEKRIVPDGVTEPQVDNTDLAGAGWEFTRDERGGLKFKDDMKTKTTDESSIVTWDFATELTKGEVSITEKLSAHPGYSLVPDAKGQYAQCVNEGDGQEISVTNIHSDTDPGFTLKGVSSVQNIRCVVYNKPEPDVKDYELQIKKVDADAAQGGQNEAPTLGGAEFTLYKPGANPNDARIEVGKVTDANSYLISGLEPGIEYTLVETKAPEGFNLLVSSIKFKVVKDAKGDFVAEVDQTHAIGLDYKIELQSDDSLKLLFTIANVHQGDLPMTGSTGILAPAMVFLVLIVGGLVSMVRRERRAVAVS